MTTRSLAAPALLAMLGLALTDRPADGRGGPPVASVRGNGTYSYDDEPKRGQVQSRAWLDADGRAHGSVVWTAVEPDASGYPWYLKVTGLAVDGNTAAVEAVIVYSPQAPEDVGTRIVFFVVDNGTDPRTPDEIGVAVPSNLLPVRAGNFTVRSAN
jgi:hypothetical protein